MIRLTLLDHAGNAVTPQDLSTAAELQEAADKARVMMRECERLVHLKASQKFGKSQGGVPYVS